jgi:NAD(P)-dependent dehydrogenase (short-subunit alcohol dehydrogenase family)
MKMLDGKIAIVTGVGRKKAMGVAIVKTLAQHGAKVVGVDILPELKDTLDELGVGAIPMKVDITKAEEVNQCVEETVKNFGRVDVLVNNATLSTIVPFEQLTKEHFDLTLAVNCDGLFNFVKAVEPIMLKQKYGRIVNISSITGAIEGSSMFQVHYATSKAGVIGFTRSAALYFAPHGVTINSICPGWHDTGAAERVLTKEQIDAWLAKLPQQRAGKPEEIAHTVAFLASELAGGITGATIVQDGGSTLQ